MKEFSPLELETLLRKYMHKCYDTGLAFVNAKSAYEKADDYKKIKFAILIDTVQGDSMSAKEKQVLKSKDWADYIDGLNKTRYDYLTAQIEYENAIRQYDTCRSLLSSKNTERRTNT